MSNNVSLLWFRQDLRLADNPALIAAREHGDVAPVFIWAPHEEGAWTPGGASRWWLHHSLESLAADLAKMDCKLVIRKGDSLETLRELIKETGATGVFWNRRYEPAIVERDQQIKSALKDDGIHVESCNGSLLFEPWEIKNKQGKPFQVFTSYWKTCVKEGGVQEHEITPRKLTCAKGVKNPGEVANLGLLPTIPWDEGMRAAWTPGEASAHDTLTSFLNNDLKRYADDRSRVDLDASSRLSPYLHFGEISPRQIWQKVKAAVDASTTPISSAANKFLAEVGWREFAHQLMFHFPNTPTEPLRDQFANFPWDDDASKLKKWQRGQTGYPIVDAAMRDLWATGWMPNRARMIVASFLTKHLLIPWQRGAEWFWDTLVDADLANNTLGWQWTAGCGADAAPYFRIFNPMTQGEKFDPDGDYIRKWCPELAKLSQKHIYQPWEASESELQNAGVRLGDNYPEPMVDHARARHKALLAYDEIKASKN